MTQEPRNASVIGVDLGGTKVLSATIANGTIKKMVKNAIPAKGSENEILDALYNNIDQVFDDFVTGIGIGVPSVVDAEKGIVYDVQNIPSWKEVHLKEILENKYNVPVYVNNDANCFALGEKYYGRGQDCRHFVALIVGTGIAAGLVINDHLYNGHNCGAGEFGMIPYKEQHFEYYSSGQFFENTYNLSGDTVYKNAMGGDESSIEMFNEFGTHLGNAIKTILYAIDPGLIILGGSVSTAYPLFKKTMWDALNQIVFPTMLEKLTIEVSNNPNIAVLGAASLHRDMAPTTIKLLN